MFTFLTKRNLLPFSTFLDRNMRILMHSLLHILLHILVYIYKSPPLQALIAA